MPTDGEYEEFSNWLIDKANDNQKWMNGTIWPVMWILNSHDVVFAVWLDDESESGVSHLVLKGKSLLEAVAARNFEALPDHIVVTSDGALMKRTAILVDCYEMAVAAMRTLGDDYPI